MWITKIAPPHCCEGAKSELPLFTETNESAAVFTELFADKEKAVVADSSLKAYNADAYRSIPFTFTCWGIDKARID